MNFGVVAKAVLFDSAQNMLILRRSHTHPCWAFQPDLPGGDVEEGEDWLTAVVREIEEEAGLIIPPHTLALAYSEDDFEDKSHHVLYWGHLPHSEPTITISWEHDQAEWLPYAELARRRLPPNCDPYFARTMRYLNQHHHRIALPVA